MSGIRRSVGSSSTSCLGPKEMWEHEVADAVQPPTQQLKSILMDARKLQPLGVVVNSSETWPWQFRGVQLCLCVAAARQQSVMRWCSGLHFLAIHLLVMGGIRGVDCHGVSAKDSSSVRLWKDCSRTRRSSSVLLFW